MSHLKAASSLQKILFVIAVFLIFTVLFLFFPPQAMDYHVTFYKSASHPLQPYTQTGFNYPPWMALVLYPLHFFSENLSVAINCSLSLIVFALLVISRKGDRLALLLTLTSFPFLSMISNGNIEWVPAIGFLLQNEWGLLFLLTKPQTGLLAVLAWMNSLKKFVLFCLVALGIMLFSFLLWGNWISMLLTNLQFMNSSEYPLSFWNIAPFPWAIPVGLGLVFYILKYRPPDQEFLGVLATICLVPYLAVYSLSIAFALLSASNRKLSIFFWILFWLYPLLGGWSTILNLLGLS
ncbi:hypothetical protein ACFLXB_09670 [Chloroflexota bacterium]